jgi:type I restriction enzyme R subunit
VIIEREFVNNRFAWQGGAKQLHKVLSNQLGGVLAALNDGLWALAQP